MTDASRIKEPPSLWGLTPQQLHDRFWAARGVQVVRQSERSEVVEGVELFLLTDPRLFVRFPLRDVVETLSWLSPDVLILRIRDVRDRGYREAAALGPDGRFVRFERTYGGADSRMARVALTTDHHVARRWQNAPDTRTGWREIRRTISASLRTSRAVEGYLYDGTQEEEVRDCLTGLVEHWATPDSSIPRVEPARRGLWADQTASVDPGARVVGNLWVGAGREIEADRPHVGPAILWDEPAARPDPEDVAWQELEPKRALDIPASASASGAFHRAVKRIFDIFFSVVVLALTLPLYPFIALAILIEDGWPIFFAHRRETLGGKEFPCVKFRSMRRDAEKMKAELAAANEADGPQFFMDEDPRLTKVGKFLRGTQLDEIPQFLNVLVGHMSVVGPRPSPHKENQFCPGWREARLSVRPGITGLWQVKRTRQKGLDFQEWIRFDLEYVERSGFWLDLWIIWQTVAVVVRGKD